MDEGNASLELINVLFVCTGNSARSIMAEAVINRLGAGKFRGFSCGAAPKGVIHPFTLDLLHTEGFKTDPYASKSCDVYTADNAPNLQFVFTVCDGAAACPRSTYRGKPMHAHWGVADPVAAEGTEAERRVAFLEAYRQLYRRIEIFCNLPMSALSRLALQQKLDAIGALGEGADTASA
ncbi:MAG: arsenate reductase ArsC [Maricaulaceae bacterium]